MADFTVSGIIEGDSSGFQDAVQQASSALTSFASKALAVFGGEELAGLFDGLVSGVTSAIGAIASVAGETQTFGMQLNDTLGSLGDAAAEMGAGVGRGSAKAAASILEAQDALIRYNEKIQEIQDNIATIMSGENIIQAQEKFADQLASIEQNYADKVTSIRQQIQDVYENQAQTHADKVQAMNDTLADMQTSHENKVADITEQYAQKTAETKSDVEKKKLQEELNAKLQLENDSFKRSYETKKAQEERGIAESDARAKAAADKKVATLNEQLTKENQLHDEQVAKLKKQEDDQISKLQTDNAKKLAMYKQELADEERSYELSQAKRAASAAGGGRRGGSSGLLQLDVKEATDDWSTLHGKAGEVLHTIDELSKKTPFTKMELDSAALHAQNLHVNFQKIGPVIADLATTKGKSFGETMQAVLSATQGKAIELARTFGINGDEMQAALGRPVKSANDVFEAIQKIIDVSGNTGAAEQFGQTLTGQTVRINNLMRDLTVSILGINEATGKPIKGGVFDILQQTVTKLANYLQAHQKDIANFLLGAIKAFEELAKIILTVAKFISDHWDVISSILIGIGVLLAVVAVALVGWEAIVAAVIGAVVSFIAGVLWAALVAVFGWIIGTFVKGIVEGISWLGKNWNNIVTTIERVTGEVFGAIAGFVVNLVNGSINWLMNQVKGLGKTISEVFDGAKTAINNFTNWVSSALKSIGNWFGDLGKKIKDALSHLDPFKPHSPPLVDQVRLGVDEIKKAYSEIGAMTINTPNIMPAYNGGGGGQVYNNYSTSSPSVSMSNNFNVNNPANASNVAAYIAYQLEHQGLF